MGSRLELNEELCKILGSRNVYFQPPESIKMHYPAIVYSRNRIESVHADNVNYLKRNSYQVTVIDEDPDSEIIEKILSLMSFCTHNQHFTSDNLNHDVFTIYY